MGSLLFVREASSIEDSNQKCSIGGQSFANGIAMSGKNFVATAVRRSDGKVELRVRRRSSLSDRYPILKLPFLRGLLSMYESTLLGIKSSNYAARVAGRDIEPLTDFEYRIVCFLSIGIFSIGLIILLPTILATFFERWTQDPLTLNLIEGAIRIGIVLLRLAPISFTKSVRKDLPQILKYHAAEHQAINCYEAGRDLTVENVRACSRFHPRCGTSQTLVEAVVSIAIFSFLDWYPLWFRILSRILLFPIIIAISHELVLSRNRVIQVLISPCMLVQYLTTQSPDDDMIEVAIDALESVEE